MGGGAGGGGPSSFVGGKSFANHGHVNGFSDTWREETLKTLEQELRDRGIEPRSGDESMQVVPTPRLTGDRVALAMVLVFGVFVTCAIAWVIWELIPG